MSEKSSENILNVTPNFSSYFLITIPFIYSLIFPVILLHIFFEIYQRICFPIYNISIVKFEDFFSTDRVRMCHLTLAEKAHCLYCDYANGCLAYVVEIAARTERFWCPIKHENKRENTHSYYNDFFEYSDDVRFRKDQKDLRKK